MCMIYIKKTVSGVKTGQKQFKIVKKFQKRSKMPKNMRHGAKNMRHSAENVLHGAKNARCGAINCALWCRHCVS